jgi:tetratricopeptide (TPR) repeat protein
MELLAKFPGSVTYRNDLARALAERGQGELLLQRPIEAKQTMAAARTILERLDRENPQCPDHATQLVGNYRISSNIDKDLGQFDDALVLLASARELLDRMIAADPANSRYWRMKAEITGMSGWLFDKQKRDDEALAAHRVAGDAFASLYQREPENVSLLTNLGVCRRNQARTHLRNYRADEAVTLLREAIGCYTKALPALGKLPAARTAEANLHICYAMLIECDRQLGRWERVEADFAELLALGPPSISLLVNVAQKYAECAGKAVPRVGPASPEDSERFEHFAGLAVQTLRGAVQTNAAEGQLPTKKR